MSSGLLSRVLSLVSMTVLFLPVAMSQPKVRQLEVTKGVSLAFPETWERGAQYRNGFHMLVRGPGAAIQAMMLITTEQRQSHAEAMRRLGDIASELQAAPTFSVIGSWPALERRYTAPLARRGEQAADEAKPALHVTVAIAADNLLVRVDTTLSPDAPPRLADEAEAIAHSATFPTRGDPQAIEKELNQLRESRRTTSQNTLLPAITHASFSAALAAPLRVSTTTGAVLGRTGGSELEIAASNDGRNVVIGTNAGFSYSNTGGVSYIQGGGTPAGFPVDGDPSLAFGASGTFYYGFIAFPDGSPAANNTLGCSTGISTSTNNGQAFQFRNNAVLCPQTGPSMCFPDQEHIAADSVNAGRGDQVYSVWRNFLPAGSPPNCGSIGSGFVTPMIVCSQDGGSNWTAPAVIGSGDFPRVTVGPDGSVFVAYRSGNSIMLNRFSSCSAGLAQQAGFPVTISSFNDVACPVPGLDRCNDGNVLSSYMVAVDRANASHIFAAYATNTATNNENIVARDSTDGGTTWPRTVTVNSSVAAHRFMPWVCTLGGTAYVTWYDRRAATAANNDLTNFYLGLVSVKSGTLQAGTELNLSTNPDPQCGARWPCGARSTADYQSCSVQPQNGSPGGGCPKYGDYNGNACASNWIYAAWASATAPPGLPAANSINAYASLVAGTTPPVICATIVWRLPPGTSKKQLFAYWIVMLAPALVASWLTWQGLRRRIATASV